MRKLVLFIAITMMIRLTCHGQLPMMQLDGIAYPENTELRSKMFVRDSMLFAVRGSGLEEYNASTKYPDYQFAGHYPLNCIIPDTGNHYIYLKSSNFIGRWDEDSQQYKNIWNVVGSASLNDLGISTDGKIWATGYSSPGRLNVFEGSQWQQYVFPGNTFYNLSVANDTLAFLYGNEARITAFHNGILDTLFTAPNYNDFKDWGSDPAGNLWLAATDKLIHYYNGDTVVYLASNLAFPSDKFLRVQIGSDGHVWVCGNSQHLYEFYNGIFHLYTVPGFYPVSDFCLNTQNEPWLICKSGSYATLAMKNGSNWITRDFPFLPFKNPSVIGQYSDGNWYGKGLFATKEGWFDVDLYTMNLTGFYDPAYHPYADEITCFAWNEPNYNAVYGTQHGVYGIQVFDNSQLPSQQVNCMIADNGSYYIGTDSGLVVFNGIFYSMYNSQNTPIPSNRITYLDVATSDMGCNTLNMLIVGTDKGLATYLNGQWKSYSGDNISIGDFYVTGVIPPCQDTFMLVSTLGKGLIKIYPDDTYDLQNTTNGEILDDTLYYLRPLQLAECGFWTIAGTAHHGIMHKSWWSLPDWDYDTLGFNVFHSSKMHAGRNMYTHIITTDSTIQLLSPCGAIQKPEPTPLTFVCYQHGNQLHLDIPQGLKADGNIIMYDITGKHISSKAFRKNGSSAELDIPALPPGIYLVRLQTSQETMSKKVVIN